MPYIPGNADPVARFVADGNRLIFGGLINNGFAEPFEFELLDSGGTIYAEIWSSVLEWDSGTTYNRGDQIIQNFMRYFCIQDNNLNNEPSVSPTFWRVITDADFNLHGFIDGTSEIYTLDTTTGAGVDGHARIALTAGADDDPLVQHVWAELDGSFDLVLATGTAFPTGPIVRLGTCGLPTLAKFQTSGATGGQQRFTNALYRTDPYYQGQLNAIMENLRSDLSYLSGILGTIDITINAGSIDVVDFSNTVGKTQQAWEQVFDAVTDAPRMFILNHPVTPFLEITGLEECDVDANNVTLRTNTDRYGLELVGFQASGTNSQNLIGVILPENKYSSDSAALGDTLGYTNTDVPVQWKGNSFRIGRAVFRYQTADNGTITNLVGGSAIQDRRQAAIGGS